MLSYYLELTSFLEPSACNSTVNQENGLLYLYRLHILMACNNNFISI